MDWTRISRNGLPGLALGALGLIIGLVVGFVGGVALDDESAPVEQSTSAGTEAGDGEPADDGVPSVGLDAQDQDGDETWR